MNDNENRHERFKNRVIELMSSRFPDMLLPAWPESKSLPPETYKNVEDDKHPWDLKSGKPHMVPRFYLRGFADKSDEVRVWAYDKQNPVAGIRLTHVKEIAVQRGAYTNAVDDWLTCLHEPVANKLLQYVRDTPISELNLRLFEDGLDRDSSNGLRSRLAEFIYIAALRSPGLRARMRPTMAQLMSEGEQDFEQIIQLAQEEYPELGDKFESEYGVPLAQLMTKVVRGLTGMGKLRDYEAKMFSIVPNPELLKTLSEGSWLFREAPHGRSYLANDSPEILKLGDEPEYRNHIYVIIPLSASIQVVGQCGDAKVDSGLFPDLVSDHDELVSLTNRSVYESAYRWVIGSDETELEKAIQG